MVCFLCGYWSQAGISHFDDQKATFQGGVKCGKSAADTVAVEVCASTALFSKGNKQNLDGRFGSCISR